MRSINICVIHGFGKEWMNLFATPCSSWSCSHDLSTLSVLKSYSTKLISYSEKRRKEAFVAHLDLTVKPWKLE